MKRWALTILSVLLGLFLLNGGLNKFLNYMPVPEEMTEPIANDFRAIVEIVWLMPLIGFAEVLGGLLLLFPKTRAVGALVVLPVMVGILLTHIFVAPEGLLIALVMWVVLLWIMYENRKKYLSLLT